MTKKTDARPKTSLHKTFFRSFVQWLVTGVVLVWLLASLILLAARWIDPPSTAVQSSAACRPGSSAPRITSITNSFRSAKSRPISSMLLSPRRTSASTSTMGSIGAQIQIAAEGDLEGGRTRGASTITQQLVKNLFFGTGRSVLRKGAEFTLVPVAEFVLGKRRILEIYLNVVEWGPGIYGAESACRYYNGTEPRSIGREQAARLAAILPAPLKRRPERMNHYSALILERMRQMNW